MPSARRLRPRREILRGLLKKNAQDNDARLGLSYALLKQRRLQDAYDHAARVIMADPLSARSSLFARLRNSLFSELRDSVEEFRTALSIQSSDSLAVAGLAMVDFYENRWTPQLWPASSVEYGAR